MAVVIAGSIFLVLMMGYCILELFLEKRWENQ
jgi:hypothetical protein